MTDPIDIVVIHGIGQQKVGSTVARWAGALEKFSRLRDRETNVVRTDISDSPAHATVVAGKAPGRPGVEYRIVEAHWADAFPQPTPPRLLRWLLLVAPGVALFQAAVLLRGITSTTGPGTSATDKVSAVFRSATMLLPIVAGVILLVVAAPVVLLVLVLLLVASVIPLPSVRKAVGSILGSLAGTIGDAFLFVADPVSRAAMVTKVGDCIRAVCAEGQGPVFVIAHSQGAAVMHRALFGPDAPAIPARLRGVITVGSGIGRLTNEFTLNPKPWTYLANVIALGSWVVFGADRFTAVQVPGQATWLLALIVAIAVSGATMLHWWGRSEDADPPRGTQGVPWLDIWAFTDLVPSGRLFPSGTEEDYEVVNVPGDLSVLRDHTHYSADFDETMPAIVDFIDGVSSLIPTTAPVRPSLRNKKNKDRNPYAPRDWAALILRSIPLVTAISLVVAAGGQDRRKFGQWLLVALPDPVTDAVDTVISPIRSLLSAVQGTWQEPPHVDSVIAIMAFVAAGMAAASVIRWSVSLLEAMDTRRWLGSEYGERWPPLVWFIAMMPVAAVSLAMSVGIYAVNVEPHWTPEQAVEGYLLGVSEGDPRRICDLLSEDAAEDLRRAAGGTTGSCAQAAETYLDMVCADARSAYAAVSVEPEGQGQSRTTARSWSPEAAPACSGAPDLDMLLPAELARAGGNWAISRLGTTDAFE